MREIFAILKRDMKVGDYIVIDVDRIATSPDVILTKEGAKHFQDGYALAHGREDVRLPNGTRTR